MIAAVLQWFKDHLQATGFALFGLLVVYLVFALQHAQAQARDERIARQNVEAQLDTTRMRYQDSLRVAERKLNQKEKPSGPVTGGTPIATVPVTIRPPAITIAAGPPQLHGPAEAVFTADTAGIELKAHVWWGPSPSAVLSATFKPIPLTYQLRCADGAPVVDITGPRDLAVDPQPGFITPDACNRGGTVVLGLRLPSLPVTAGLIGAGAALVLAIQRVVHF